VKRLLAH
jgi:antitoxin HicB